MSEQENETQNNSIEVAEIVNSLQDCYFKESHDRCRYVGNSDMLTLYWCIVKILRTFQPQPRQLDSIDTSYADFLRAKKFSLSEIGFVLNRSKSTLCEYFKLAIVSFR